jgi:hypothetical protein
MYRAMKHLLFVTSVSVFFVCPASVLPDAGRCLFVNEATAADVPAQQNVVSNPRFSHERGFYDQAFELAISCATPEATIYYTTDGSEPYQQGGRAPTGTVYTQPIRIAKTTCVRAVAAKQGWTPSYMVTQTYLFAANVLLQSARPPGWPTDWKGRATDYEMDPDILSNPQYGSQLQAALLSLPSMSLVMNQRDLFDAQTGIYSNPLSSGVAWEKPGSIELIYPDGTEGFQVNCGVRVQGGYFRDPSATPKHSFRLLFKAAYGPTKLQYPLFGKDAPDKFDTIVLRSGANDAYSWSGNEQNAQYTRDPFMHDLQRAMGHASGHGMFVHLYLNGLYWGLYNPCERPDGSFSSTYYGGQKEDWDVFKHKSFTLDQGDRTALNLMLSQCQDAAKSYEALLKLQGKGLDGAVNPAYPCLLDLPNYVDYMILNLWAGNWDWPWNNYWLARNRTAESTGFKFYCWDGEDVMLTSRSPLTMNGITSSNAATDVGQPHSLLKNNPEYRLFFADRVHRLFFNGGILMPDSLIGRYAKLTGSVEQSIVAEAARWGDQHGRNVTPQDWTSMRDKILKTYLPQRTAIVLDQFRSAGLYPSVDAPVFYINGNYQHGGHIAASDAFSIKSSSGTIYYTLDGSDPRLSAQAAQAGGSPTLVAENAPKRVLVPTASVNSAWRGGQPFDDSAWTAVTGSPGGVGYERSTGYETLINIDLGQQMYGKQTTCYIRIPFTLDRDPAKLDAVQLRVRYDDGFIAYINGTEVARRNFTGEPAWNSAASTQNDDTSAVNFEDIALPNARDCLKNGANVLAIQGLNISTSSSDLLISVMLVTGQSTSAVGGTAATGAVRYASPITLSRSVCVKSRTLSGTTWSALNEAVFAVGPMAQSLRISELMYHPLNSGNPNDPNAEFVELTNIANQSINLNLVRFTDGIDYTFPSFDLPAGGYCLIVKNIAAFQAKYGSKLPVVGQYTGSLSNAGEHVELVDAAGTIIQSFTYDDHWFKITDGLGFSLTVTDPKTTDANSLNDQSTWRPSAFVGGSPGSDDRGQVPELGAVVINELLANSQGIGPDWIELCNTTNQAIDIGDWFLSDDANDLTKYKIAAGTSIPAGGYLVFYQDKHFGNEADPGCKTAFGLSKDGETVYLHSGSNGVLTGYSQQEKFDASEVGVSLGRYPKSTGSDNFVALSAPTPGKANAVPAVGPVVINEIMYHPLDMEDAEYVELLNISSSAVMLYDAMRKAPWRFTDDPQNPSIELLFPTDAPVTLAPGEYMILAKDASMLRTKYSIPANVKVLAWGAGNLANGGQKIQLSKPGDQDAQGNRSWIRLDRVVYSDGLHPQDFAEGVDTWPVEANGKGKSLGRINPQAYGNDPVNWRASTPSPGQ